MMPQTRCRGWQAGSWPVWRIVQGWSASIIDAVAGLAKLPQCHLAALCKSMTGLAQHRANEARQAVIRAHAFSGRTGNRSASGAELGEVAVVSLAKLS